MNRLRLFLLWISAITLLGCATTGRDNVTVLVTGIGSTVEDARRAAFRDAIQLANGSLNLSERRVVNDKLFEDDVSYARGVIDSFQEVSRTTDPKDKQYRIQMSVTVSPTAIQKRLLAAQDSKSVSGNEIGRQMDQAQQQIRSEVERYMAARRLFEHITRGMAPTLFDVTTGKVETVRNGANISSSVLIKTSLNPKVLESLCAAAGEYQNSRTAGIPENFRKNMSYLSIRHAYNCFTDVEVEPSHMASIAQDLDGLGICLNLEDGAGQRLRRLFYQPQSPGLVKTSLVYTGSQGQYIDSGAYLLRGYSRAYVEYPTAVFLVRKAWGNDEETRLELPNLPPNLLQRLAKITATLSNDQGCTGPKPKATSSLGLRLAGHPGAIVVEDIVSNSPAALAQFVVGDQILSIDSVSLADLTVQQTANLLTGKSRSFVNVEVFRKSVNGRGVLRISVP
jgi:hypothetical protein